MSLNWDISKIENHEQFLVEAEDGSRILDGLTQALIWTSMATGLGKAWSLDAEFAPEFYARVKLLEKLGGPLVTKQGEPVEVTWDDIQARIGLEVNVSPVTRAKFLKNAVESDLNRWKRLAETAQAERALDKV